jgi:DNA-binding transcriptional MerR regulator
MLTVTRLARSCGLSRSTVLYYERIGLIAPPGRSAANYRRYGDKALDRLRQICVYRRAGLRLDDIRALLDRPEHDAAAVLKRRLSEIDAEIGTLRGHQLAILKLLRNRMTMRRNETMTKEKWVFIMEASGFSKDDMQRWRHEFERAAPEEHQQFLEYLHIPVEEIRLIRESSRKGGAPAH